MSGFMAVAYFLLSIFFNSIIFILWTKVALSYLKISRLNSIYRLISTITNPIILPFYKFLKVKENVRNRIDWPVITLIIFTEILKILFLSLLAFHAYLPFYWLMLFVVADFIIEPCNYLFFAVLIRVILSYVNPYANHALLEFLYLLTEPFFVLGRKFIPNISGFDFSPFFILILLKVITLFIHASLPFNLL